MNCFFFFSSRRRHTRSKRDWSSDVCSSDLKSKVFPPMVISMIAVGEQTGGLDEMLSKIADFYDEEVDAAVSTLLSLMEPIMIVVLGVIVGGMVVAMYLPIFFHGERGAIIDGRSDCRPAGRQ